MPTDELEPGRKRRLEDDDYGTRREDYLLPEPRRSFAHPATPAARPRPATALPGSAPGRRPGAPWRDELARMRGWEGIVVEKLARDVNAFNVAQAEEALVGVFGASRA